MAPSNSSHRIVIVGAGFGGLGFAIWLKRNWGLEDFIIIEKASDIGGTWRDNTYPGCSSDVPIHWYSLSTDLKPDWAASYGYQPEIQNYMLGLVSKYKLRSYCMFDTRVVSADWDSSARVYHIVAEDTQTGSKKEITATILISATGILSEPCTPGLKDAHTFKGTTFHSATWRNDVPLEGKRVAVIGNGCSATQFVPLIAKDPSVTVTQFCRTPMWYMKRDKPPYSEATKWVFSHLPITMRLHRYMIAVRLDLNYAFMYFYGGIVGRLMKRAMTNYVKQTAPSEYHDLVIPSYPPGCKRLIIDTGYLSALHRPNLTLTGDGIEKFTETGIITQKGDHIPFDVIIYATGFTTNRFPYTIRGSSGQTMNEYWESQGGPTAYLGSTVPGFPNFFMIQGPNTTTGHASVIFTQEVQFDYALKLFEPIISGELTSLEPTQSATTAYNSHIQDRLSTSVWSQCASWYRSGPDGKIHSSFPGPVIWYWWLLRRPQWGDYLTRRGDKTQPVKHGVRALTWIIRLAAAVVLGAAGRAWLGSGVRSTSRRAFFVRA
ncbi:hypothetical protein EVG20_g8819 [Dentipellis fragilis]|uniref:FAD/NAD(P)-binding domain-containing protein n=1 Tax=Dentipellis fragilis TaxID=205917 RepID=A0A4Y9Y3N8_9AGAM|nr:hypothetical protein EVG20_g8819 [Dentipellis fragilis]